MDTGKVVWSEGLFLKPHHFQQQDRYFETLLTQHQLSLHKYAWGIKSITISSIDLQQSKLTIQQCSAIFPDGTFINAGQGDISSLTLDNIETNTIIYLAITKSNEVGLEVDLEGTPSKTRYNAIRKKVKNTTDSLNEYEDLIVSKLNIFLTTDNNADFEYIPILQFSKYKSDNTPTFRTDFFPPLLYSQGNPAIQSLLEDSVQILQQRRHSLATRFADNSSIDRGMVGLLILQSINRYLPLLEHALDHNHIPPIKIFEYLLQLINEVATFTTKPRYYEKITYDHIHLYNSFHKLNQALHQVLNYVIEDNIIEIPINYMDNSVFLGSLEKITPNHRIILAVSGKINKDIIRNQLPYLIKIASPDEINDLIRLQLPGIPIDTIIRLPYNIPFYENTSYFEINHFHDKWESLIHSRSIAMHISDFIPDMKLYLWAMKEE
ncbi:type VI secretion protein, family [Piscirickettsia salmonis]|uniref:type VI secretion system baseplate subunit TssK n=1 Tax=Piscirickettsia salmonis TaxID=1238 RepID=UPI0012BAFB8A|nr:type VI secretion system baseplate subunit TssK [Piscirickettsia salmonis]QGP53556.1 type VI secretion protein, family [Piscirickettsia salmonis]QGP60528.1 type VI secretion protein, family [Piscirickettsia salmonis]QGP63127.1 type VI secretion protein, family [Piscirickettsia salmonis]